MSQTVLVVEDTELLRRMYADRLSSDGYQVLLAGDGLEALSTLRSATPDLILLDLVMPMMSGLEVLELVKKDPRLSRIPVIILSNLGQEADIARCMEMGVADYLVKNDARPTDISARVTEVLRGTVGAEPTQKTFKLSLRDRSGDADAFVEAAGLARRFWCPTCEVELSLELICQPEKPGWYHAHLMCPMCGREY